MTDEAPEDVGSPPSEAPRRRGRVITAAAMVIVLIATTTLAVVFGLKLHNKNALEAAESQALEAARLDAVYITTYDYRTLADDFANAERNMTPGFRQKFQQTGSLLRPVLTKDQASAKGTVKAAAVSSGTTSRVVILAFVDQKVLKPGSTEAQTVTVRMQMTMVKSDGHWLMGDVRIVG